MSAKRVLLVVLVASAVMLVGTLAPMAVAREGVWKTDGANQIATPRLSPFINIWLDDVDNYEPAVAYNSLHDEYLVVWYNDQGGGLWDIYARRVRGDGTLLSDFCVVSDVGRKNWQPDVAYSPTQDAYLVVYTYEVNASDYDLWAKRVGWNGGWMSAEIHINQEAGKQWNPAVAYNSQNDEYLVVYENWWGGGLRDIAAQRVKASDGSLLSWRNIATGAGEERVFPDVAYNQARNEYLIVYGYGPSNNGGIRGKVASTNLGTLGSEVHICEDFHYDQDFPAVAAGPDEYLVVWEDGDWSTNNYDIFARRVNGDGSQGPSGGFEIDGIGDSNLHVNPAVAYGAGYGYLVAWRYYEGGSNQNIYGRYVMPGQDSAAGEEFAIDGDSGSQRYPAVACNPSGDCLVVEDDNYPGPDYEIRGRFVRPHHIYLPLTLRNHQ